MPKDGSEPATKSDLQLVKSELQIEIQSVKSELQAEIQGVRKELTSKIDSVKTELKDDIQRVEETTRRIALDQVKMREAMATKDDVESLRTDVRQNTKTLETFLSRIETYDRESVTFPNLLDEHGAQLKNLDKRVTALESKP